MKRNNLTILLLLLVFAANAESLRAYLSYSIFNTPQNMPYIETYLAVSGNSVVKVMNKDSLYHGIVDVQIIFRKNDSIINFDKYEISGPQLKDSTANVNYIGVERYALPNGNYQLELSLKDRNSPEEPIFSFAEFSINFPADSMTFSDIEFLQKFVKDSTSGKLAKSGFELFPYVFNYFPEDVSTLSFYSELYNSNKIMGDGQFLLNYYIRPFEVDKKLDNYFSMKKVQGKDVNIVLNTIDISKLPSGNYLLVIEARDRKNELIVSKETFFQRFNSRADNQLLTIAAIETENTFVSDFPIDSMRMFIDYLDPISTQSEKIFVKANIKTADLQVLQQYFLGFWLQRSALPEVAWKDYKARVNQANYNFKTVSLPGFKSDRGRIYLQYGQPNTIAESYNEPAAYPYTIWHYYSTGGQRDVKFVFYAHDVATNDFQLIHSTAVGELQNYAWQNTIYQRTWGFESVDKSTMPPSWGNNLDTYYLYPR